jgi:TDG/mug DNA glycosylase family protein
MHILPDVLDYGLKVVFCGLAAGRASARAGAYYAGPGNRFWETLYRIGLTPRQLDPREYDRLPAYGIGLTDLVKAQYGADSAIIYEDDARESLRARILEYAPRVLAFNGKRAAQEFFGYPVRYGQHPDSIGETVVFVLPSTSGAARGHWDETYWAALALHLRSLADEEGT